jgi:hypothetical protein
MSSGSASGKANAGSSLSMPPILSYSLLVHLSARKEEGYCLEKKETFAEFARIGS